ncbi:hypothetical protein BDV27DRAFT_127689 [Aspergillus caelatus]|uniref:Uncharacterized protein n=1 Tax=Aspergillus caelatus TaxID=61420 RepID=A0A5N7A5E0_9EURO|nr:uncharacterized protein BDV27DRAFT_127689 [Aspergillus caelatus]KAE8364915.1 hypothetical protein BDV27DRAFT_127689 [Aspergillus caelatus]
MSFRKNQTIIQRNSNRPPCESEDKEGARSRHCVQGPRLRVRMTPRKPRLVAPPPHLKSRIGNGDSRGDRLGSIGLGSWKCL